MRDDWDTVTVTKPKKIQPGDLLDVTVRLRRLLSAYQTDAYLLYADFALIEGGEAIAVDAEKARHTLELAATRVGNLLTKLEATPQLLEIRTRVLADRKRSVYKTGVHDERLD